MAWAPDYTTVADLAEYMRITDDVDDDQLARAVTSASRAIDDVTNRQFGKVAEAVERFYTPAVNYERRKLYAVIDDLQDITELAVEVDGVAVTSDGYQLEPRNAAADGKPYTRIVLTSITSAAEVAITGLWGWNAVPDTVVEACHIQADRFAHRRESPYGVAGSPSDGSEVRLLAKADPDVAFMLRGYTRPRRLR